MDKTNYNIILDCGHGGVDSLGKYTTAPAKMFTFSNGEVAYEGKLNREIGKRVGDYLTELGYCPLYTVAPSDSKDVSLKNRVTFANKFNSSNTIFISFHSNASDSHTARGFEIWTSIGETRSDIIATYIGEEITSEFSELKFRSDYTDKDIDKESNFYVLKYTNCPSVLLENLFFDNYDDYKLLCSESFQKRLSWRITQGIIRYLKTLR